MLVDESMLVDDPLYIEISQRNVLSMNITIISLRMLEWFFHNMSREV